jgi:ubiquinone/menaquinone biosynthesis C-methylase UbiE
MLKVEVISDRNIVDECLDELANSSKVVFDLGGQRPFNKMLAKHKHLFDKVSYFCLDICPNSGLSVVGDIQNLPLKSESVDGVICHSVLEHVFEPQIAVREIYRVLKPGGLGFFHVPFLHPYHGSNDGKDCYRFTKDGLFYMFRNFEYMKIQPQDGYLGVTLKFLTGFRQVSKNVRFVERFLEKVITIFRRRGFNKMNNNSGFIFLVRK